MPRYDYECTGCGRQVEDQRPIRERDWPSGCKVCFAEMRRMPAAPANKFKGQGWTPKFHNKGVK